MCIFIHSLITYTLITHSYSHPNSHTHSPNHSLQIINNCLLIDWLIYLPTNSHTHPLTHLHTHSPTYTPIHPPTLSPTHAPTHPPTHPLTHPPTHPRTLPSTHPCTYTPIHAPTHPSWWAKLGHLFPSTVDIAQLLVWEFMELQL